MKNNYIDIKIKTPNHKDLVLCYDGKMCYPAIYYNNNDFIGFYKYTTYYHNTTNSVYAKCCLKDKHEIINIISWQLIEQPEQFKVGIYESELGWGTKLEEIKEFTTKEEADKFIIKYNKTNDKKVVPNWYMFADKYNY